MLFAILSVNINVFDQFNERFIVLHFFARNLWKSGAIDLGMFAPETFVSLLLLLLECILN